MARRVRAIRTAQKGEIRSAPQARWMAFTAEEVIEARTSRFRWEARFRGGAMSIFTVTDAYEERKGSLIIKLGGLIPAKKMVGPDVDKGELQRYLAAVVSCPPMLVNNDSLEWSAAGPSTLRVRDGEAAVDVDLDEKGRPLLCRAHRPRTMGKKSVETPWTGTPIEFREWDGLRVANVVEAAWHPPEGAFTYFRGEVTSFEVL